MHRTITWSFILAMFAVITIANGAQTPKSAPLTAMQLRVKENICLAPIGAGINVKQFTNAISADQKQRLVAVSSAATLQQVFSSIDLDKNGTLSPVEVQGAKGGDDKYCGANCDQTNGSGCPAKCHCHRNEGRCAHDGR